MKTVKKIINQISKNMKKNNKKILIYLKKIKKQILNFKKNFSKKLKKQKNFKTTNKKIDYKTLTVNQIENELYRTKYNEKYANILRSTIYSLIIIASIAVIIATLIMPVLEINGSYMEPNYKDGEIIVSIKTKKLKPGDIIAFYHGNKILVKRVIASSGSYVIIDEEGNVFVDGTKLEESYIDKKSSGEPNIEYPYQVPDGEWFVLSDEREQTIDSRNKEIGCVKQENIIGKILFRIWPLNK